ncbi:MAG: beta-ketoacyl synthase chain length factor [Bacteroidales bacterium]|nr:beta-ketoacyl synthase chain length factor [Bacteroidales bacterium]
MNRRVYIRSLCYLGAEDPDFRELFSVLEARRMSRLLKRAVWTSAQALKAGGTDCPDAIITATDFGCIEQSEAFLRALKGMDGAVFRPTHFMQSTHNTIGSLIAIRLGCHGYNVTYSHRGESFASALLDAWMQLTLGDIDTALVGWFDETTPLFSQLVPQARDRAFSLLLTTDPQDALAELSSPDPAALQPFLAAYAPELTID